MATEANATPMLDSVNTAIKDPAINESAPGPSDCIPPMMHPPLTYFGQGFQRTSPAAMETAGNLVSTKTIIRLSAL